MQTELENSQRFTKEKQKDLDNCATNTAILKVTYDQKLINKEKTISTWRTIGIAAIAGVVIEGAVIYFKK